jgi:beta-lactamase regulating signal transducer with metallopeptidase domain
VNWLVNVAAATALSAAVNSICLGLLIAALAALAVRALPRTNAATRYAIWFTALALIAALPVFLLLLPAPVAATSAAHAAITPVMVPVTSAWPVYALAGWALITLFLLARVVWSLGHIRTLKRAAVVVGQRGSIDLLASTDVRVPMAAGFLRRAVLFPRWALEDLTLEEFEQVLAHELAHLRRRDDWTQLAQATAQAVLFFNPAVYWIARRLKIEREIACDDWVVLTTAQARPYATCLTRLHELTRRAAAPQLASAATGPGRWQISVRIAALLAVDRSATPRLARSGWFAAAALAAAAVFAAVLAPPLAGVQALPLAKLPVAQLKTPAPPVVLASVVKPAPRPRLLASRGKPPVHPALKDSQYVVLSAWQIQSAPHWTITVVFPINGPPIIFTGI